MNLELKKRDLKKNNVLKFYYCEIQNIEQYLKELWNTYWSYGRNETIYIITEYTNYLISTGYRPTWERPKNIEKRLKLEKSIKNKKRKEKTIKRNYEKKFKRINKKIYELTEEHIKIKHNEK